MDVIVEILLEVYMELMMLIIPEKNISKKHKLVATIAAIAVLILMFGLVIFGVYLIADKGNLMGIIPIAVVVMLSVAQITAGIILYKRNH